MGGSASGSWYRWSKKSTNENFHRFSISRLKELGVVDRQKWGSGNWQWTIDEEVVSSISYELNTLDSTNPWLRVHYTHTNSGDKHDYRIYLCTTSPHYGGVRWWFKCPRCYRRVGVLFLGNIFACRHCWDMAYASQNQRADSRYTDRAFAIARKLGLEGNVIDGFWGEKPKGMHWKTFNQRKEQLDWLCDASMFGLVNRFSISVDDYL